MRVLLSSFAVLLCACDFTFAPGNEFLALQHGPLATTAGTATTNIMNATLYLGADGSVWVVTDNAVLTAIPLAPHSQPVTSDGSLTSDGLLESIQNAEGTYDYTLRSLSGKPTVSFPQLGDGVPAVRGPGFLIVGSITQDVVTLAFDDGTRADFATGGTAASPTPLAVPVDGQLVATSPFSTDLGVVIEGHGAYDSRWITFTTYDSHDNAALAELDLEGRLYSALGASAPSPGLLFAPDHRLWQCTGSDTSSFDVVALSSVDLGLPCASMWLTDGQPTLSDTGSGVVLHLATDGTITLADSIGASTILAAHGDTYLVGAALDTSGFYSGTLDGDPVMKVGYAPFFSPDGARLYWLENAVQGFGTTNTVGDLYAYEVATRKTTHLLQDVSDYAVLSDGRIVAIADAAETGPWNEVVLVDPVALTARTLADDMQAVQLVGDHIVATNTATSTLTLLVP